MVQKPQIIFEESQDISDKKHILVIDDDPETLKTLRFYLQDDYKVSVVSSGKVAVEFLLKFTPDLILLDYLMPMYNGAAVFKIIQNREETRNIPVIFLTGQTDKATVMECLALGPAGYIVKPVAKQALLAKLKSVFSQ